MADVDTFSRHYAFVDALGDASGTAIAALLEAAATTLRQHGEITVHHVDVDVSTDPAHASSLTVYYDRVERRSHLRT